MQVKMLGVSQRGVGCGGRLRTVGGEGPHVKTGGRPGYESGASSFELGALEGDTLERESTKLEAAAQGAVEDLGEGADGEGGGGPNLNPPVSDDGAQDGGGGGGSGWAHARSMAEKEARFGAAALAISEQPPSAPLEPHPHGGEEGEMGGRSHPPTHTQTSSGRSGGPGAGRAKGKESAAIEAGASRSDLDATAAALARSSGDGDEECVAAMEAAERGGSLTYVSEHSSLPARPPFPTP